MTGRRAAAGVLAGATATCGALRAGGGAFRDQARVLVDERGLQGRSLSLEAAVRDAEQQLRRACRGRPDGARPYARTRAAITGSDALDGVPWE
jgi:hypothetical protein